MLYSRNRFAVGRVGRRQVFSTIVNEEKNLEALWKRRQPNYLGLAREFSGTLIFIEAVRIEYLARHITTPRPPLLAPDIKIN